MKKRNTQRIIESFTYKPPKQKSGGIPTARAVTTKPSMRAPKNPAGWPKRAMPAPTVTGSAAVNAQAARVTKPPKLGGPQ